MTVIKGTDTLYDPPLEADRHPKEKVVALYARRWQVELFFDDMKTTMRLEMMRTKSTAMLCPELLLHMIVYNLLRASITRSGADPRRASFKGVADRLQTWQWVNKGTDTLGSSVSNQSLGMAFGVGSPQPD
jgi:Transposase DDE domain